MNRTIASLLLSGLLVSVAPVQGALIQFGGDATIVSDSAYELQIGADQVIQWNGVNSDGGSFGASGSLTGMTGAPVGSTLTSLGLENLTLTSRGFTGGSATFASGLPNVLGVFGGGDNAKIQSGPGESWSFDFNQDVVLKHLVFSALDGAGETIRLSFEGGDTTTFTRSDSLMAAVTYGPTNNRFVYTPAGAGIPITAGQDITLGSNQGAWGVQAIVVEAAVIPEPGASASLLGLFTASAAQIGRRRR